MKQKRKSWSRRAKIVRNLLLAALLGLLTWDAWGWPSFSFHADLRRQERRMLFPEPETAVELVEQPSGQPFRIDQAGDVALTSFCSKGRFFTNAQIFLRKLREGPDLIALPLPVHPEVEADDPYVKSVILFAALRPPEGSARAVLTLYNDTGDIVLTSEGEQDGDVFWFYIGREYLVELWTGRENETLPEGYTYELAFYDGDNDILQEITG